MSQTLRFATSINAPISKVRSTMLDHPTYEAWTTAFCPGSTYTGSWEQSAEIKFLGPDGSGGMLATIAQNTTYEYISIKHLGEIKADGEIVEHTGETSFENYKFTKINENTTRLDIEMTAIPDDWVDMFNEMRPKALDLLKELCEK